MIAPLVRGGRPCDNFTVGRFRAVVVLAVVRMVMFRPDLFVMLGVVVRDNDVVSVVITVDVARLGVVLTGALGRVRAGAVRLCVVSTGILVTVD